MREKRREERYVVPEIYRKYIQFKVKEASGNAVDAELFNFSSKGISIKSRCRFTVGSPIECSISAPKSLTKEIPFTGRIKYCIEDEPGGDYLAGAEIIRTADQVWFDLFLKVHDFIKRRIGDIY
jgi:CRISPR/Cas system-associated protein Csx1